MKKEKKAFMLFAVFIFGIFLIGAVSAENLNLKISGSVNSLKSDFYARTNSNSIEGKDGYDMLTQSLPSGDYAQFYSAITGSNLMVDSWSASTNPRTLNLVYHASTSQTGTLTLSWTTMSGSYEGTLNDYGADSTRTTSVGSADMRSVSSYSVSVTNMQNRYMILVIDAYTAPSSGTTTTGGSGGGGGGGGGGGATTPATAFSVDKNTEDVYSAVDKVKLRYITVKNSAGVAKNFEISQSGFDEEVVRFSAENFSLGPGESKKVEVKYVSPSNPDVLTGKIIVQSGAQVREVLVTLNVQSEEVLFDSSVSLVDKKIATGNPLNAQITLIPMGENPRLDVTLKYTVKDYNGKVYLSESETILVDSQKSFKKDFSSAELPAGEYVLALEVIYPNGVATSSSNFAILASQSPLAGIGKDSLPLILLGGIVLLMIFIIFLVVRYRRLRRRLTR